MIAWTVGIGIGDMAIELRLGDGVGQERERDRLGIARLTLQAGRNRSCGR